MGKPNKPTGNQIAWNNARTGGMRKDGLRRAAQLVKARGFIYDGSLAPTCLRCGGVREDRRGLHCNYCLRQH